SYFSEGKYGRGFRVSKATDDLLQGGDDMGCDDNRIDVLLRLSGVTSLSSDMHVDLVGGGHVFSGPESNLSAFDQRHHVLADDRMRGWIFKHAFADHNAGTAG